MTDPRQSEFRALYLGLRIDEQLRFYTGRREEYGNAKRQAIQVRNAFLGVAALCGVLGPFVGVAVRPGLGIAAAVLGGLAAAVTGFEALIGFARLEKLYGDAVANLTRARIQWTALSAEADATAEVAMVEEIFHKEIGQWGQLEVATPPAVAPPAPKGDAG